MKDRRRSCELCNNHATLYCASDSAFLCFNCDSRVHGANFLVARHLRHPLCSQCNSLAAHPIAGDAINIPNYKLCSSCSPENHDDENDTLSISSSFDSAYSSACVPSTESSATTTKQQRSESSSVTRLSGRATSSFAKKKVAGDTRFEGTFVNWCEKMGMSGGNWAAMSAAASHALGFCMGRLAGVPLRVTLAASFWFGVRMTSSSLGSTCQNLRRVEMMSGVPARMFLAVEAKLRRELMRVRRGTRPAAELEEGWAEC